MPADPRESPVQSTSSRTAPKVQQPCRACQQRKRKCDRKRPQCSMCEKRGIDCVFDLKLSERNPTLLTNLVSALEDKDRRIAALEGIIRDRIPDLAHITLLETETLAPRSEVDLKACTTESSSAIGKQDRRPSISALDPGSQLLSPSLVDYIEEALRAATEAGGEHGGRHRRPSVISAISSQLGVEPTAEEAMGETPSAAAWPPYELALQVVDVFVQTNSLWPIFRRVDLMKDLEQVYEHGTATDPDKNATPLQTYTLFLIFSIACVWLAQRGNGDRIDTSLLRNRALVSLRTILRTESGFNCISALALLSLSAIYDWGGPDHVQLTPIIGEVALAIELHLQPPSFLSLEEKDKRRLMFWGIYCMDRAVAGNVGSDIYFVNKDAITVELPTCIDPVGSLGEGFAPLAFFKHLMAMWDLTCEVNRHTKRSTTAEETAKLHGRLDEWYSRTPRPAGTPTLGGRLDDGDSIFDQYYQLMIAILYRPRNFSTPAPEHILILQEAASKALRVSMAIQAQHKLFDNYYQFNSIIGLGGTLLCVLLLHGGDPANAHDPVWVRSAVSEIRGTQSFIGLFCRGWPYARGMSGAFDTLAGRIVNKLYAGLGEARLSGNEGLSPEASTSQYSTIPGLAPVDSSLDTALADALTSAATNLSLADASLVPGLEMPTAQSLDGTWDAWLNDSLVPIDSRGLGDTGNVDMNTLLATFGASPDWLSALVSGVQTQG